LATIQNIRPDIQIFDIKPRIPIDIVSSLNKSKIERIIYLSILVKPSVINLVRSSYFVQVQNQSKF